MDIILQAVSRALFLQRPVMIRLVLTLKEYESCDGLRYTSSAERDRERAEQYKFKSKGDIPSSHLNMG